MALNLLNHPSWELLEQLDWKIIVEKIANTTHFWAAKEALCAPPTAQSVQILKRGHRSVQFLIERIQDESFQEIKGALSILPPEGGFEELTERLQKGSVLSIPELHQLAKHLECYFALGRILREWIYFSDYQVEGAHTQILAQKFVKPLREFVSSDGEIDYARCPRLAPLYSELQRIEETIREQLNHLITKQYATLLQYDQYDILNDRYVLPVKSHSYRQGLGMILGHSDSGMTLYVEPISIKKLAAERLSLLAKIEEELFILCKEFSDTISPFATLFGKLRALCYTVDIELAKAQFSLQYNLTEPEIATVPEIELEDFFHPLIKDPIKNDIRLKSSDLGLILSGPNTGGKTVSLKAVTLSQLFLHAGLFIPARSAKIYPFTGVFYFGRDSQDLTQGLSSFAAEVKNYLGLLNELESENLVVIDEIFNSTSSEEASALALTLFSEIHQKSKTYILASTHHQMLKALVHQEKSYRSAHVGLDPATHRPTYKIIEGLPGSSMALTIFSHLSKRFGFENNKMAERAQKILEEKAHNYEMLLQELSHTQQHLDKLVVDNEKRKSDLVQEQKQQEHNLKHRMEHRFHLFDDKLRKNLMRAQQLLKTMEEDQVKQPRTYVRSLSEIRSRHNIQEQQIPGEVVHTSAPYLANPVDEIKVGESYYCIPFKKRVTVKEILPKKGSVMVQSGSLTFHVHKNDLRSLKDKFFGQSQKGEEKRFHFSRTKAQENTSDHDGAEDEGKGEDSYTDELMTLSRFDARGMRFEAFQSEVERRLDLLLAGDLFELVILHGHGPLKTWLRDYLKNNDNFNFEVPEKPGDSVTRITCQN